MDLLSIKHYTLEQAAAKLAEIGIEISPRTLRRRIDAGELACRRPGGRLVIGEDQLNAFLEAALVPERPADPPVYVTTRSTQMVDMGQAAVKRARQAAARARKV